MIRHTDSRVCRFRVNTTQTHTVLSLITCIHHILPIHPSIHPFSMPSTPPTNHQPNVIHCFTQLLAKSTQDADHAQLLGSVNAKTASAHRFRARVFRTVLTDMETHFGPEHPLVDVSMLKGRKGYGKGTLKRIQEIMDTGTLQELTSETTPATPTTPSTKPTTTATKPTTTTPSPPTQLTQLRDLITLTGVGPVKARFLVEQNITRQQLKQWCRSEEQYADELARAKLTHHQRLGVKYDDDVQHRIPRTVIQRVDTLLQSLVSSTNHTPTLPETITICGSYRRGQPDSGDVDVLMTHSEWTEPKQATTGLRNVLTRLHDTGVLVDDLTDRAKVHTKYMGFLRVPNHPWALRIDIRAVVKVQYIPALAYFTGSKEENVRLRGIAMEKGMRLNEYGLVREGDTRVPVVVGTEEELYGVLGEGFKRPGER